MLEQTAVAPYKVSYIKALKASFLLIFLATISYRIADQFLTRQIEGLIKSSDGIGSMIWLWGGLSLILAIAFPTWVSVISIYALKNNSVRNLRSFLKNNFELAVLETLRAWGYSFLWALLFIVPGLIRMSFYYLTLFVVLLLPEYEKGEVDALKKSTEISKVHWFKLNFLVFAFYIFMPLLITTIFDEYIIFIKNPMTAVMFAAIETLAILLFHYIVLKLFIDYFLPQNGETHGTHV